MSSRSAPWWAYPVVWGGAAACAHADGPQATLPTATLVVGTVDVVAEIALGEHERSMGLMFRESMPPDQGMLFVYPDEKPRSFWMKNTRLPLSIAFADAQGRIVRIADMQPFDERSVPSDRPAMYALEMNQGWFVAHGIAVGQQLKGLPTATNAPKTGP